MDINKGTIEEVYTRELDSYITRIKRDDHGITLYGGISCVRIKNPEPADLEFIYQLNETAKENQDRAPVLIGFYGERLEDLI